MTVQANWNLSALDLGDDSDPIQSIMDSATIIDLSKPFATLTVELKELADREASLFQRHGVECDRKWQPDTSCYDCPHFEGDRTDTTLSTLCRLGRKQEDKLSEMEKRREHDHAVEVVLDARLRDECAEIAERLQPV